MAGFDGVAAKASPASAEASAATEAATRGAFLPAFAGKAGSRHIFCLEKRIKTMYNLHIMISLHRFPGIAGETVTDTAVVRPLTEDDIWPAFARARFSAVRIFCVGGHDRKGGTMDTRLQRLAAEMLMRYAVKGESDIAVIPYTPQKTESFSSRVSQRFFPRATPEETGVSSRSLERLISFIEEEREANVHNIEILRKGRVICEASAPGYSTGTWCLTHSMAKSITAIAVGMLVDDGRLALSDRLCDLLADECPPRMHPYMRQITLWHLLSMSAGVTSVSEVTAVVDEHWTRTFLESRPSFEPGTAFRYNSMNSYMLSVIVRRISGMGLAEFLTERLWRPLGVRNFFCEYSPEGIEKGGWGMYIAPEDLLKIGQLFLQKGMWNGERLLSEEWIERMTTVTFHTADENKDYHYGLHLWVAADEKSWLFSGMLGQNLWICPSAGTAVAITSGNCQVFERSAVLRAVAGVLGADAPSPDRLPKAGEDLRRLRRTCLHYGEKYRWTVPLPPPGRLCRLWSRLRRRSACPLPGECEEYRGTYRIEKNNVGVLPLFVRFMQNNHTKGMDRITFSEEGDRFLMTVEEGREVHTLTVGFYAPAKNVLNCGGELYDVMVAGQFAETEDRDRVLKIELIFPEIPNTRRIRIYREGNGLRIALSELPGRRMVDGLIESHVPELLRSGGLVGYLRTKMFGADPLKCIGPVTEPVLYAAPEETAALPAVGEGQTPDGAAPAPALPVPSDEPGETD